MILKRSHLCWLAASVFHLCVSVIRLINQGGSSGRSLSSGLVFIKMGAAGVMMQTAENGDYSTEAAQLIDVFSPRPRWMEFSLLKLLLVFFLRFATGKYLGECFVSGMDRLSSLWLGGDGE